MVSTALTNAVALSAAERVLVHSALRGGGSVVAQLVPIPGQRRRLRTQARR